MRCTLLLLIPFVAAFPAGNAAPHPSGGSLAKRSPTPILDSKLGQNPRLPRRGPKKPRGPKKGGLLDGIL